MNCAQARNFGAIVDPSVQDVRRSSRASQASACAGDLPHISAAGRSLEQTAGRSGRPKIRQRLSGSSCTQRTPAGLPWGMSGMAEEMEGAMQQAPHPGRQSMDAILRRPPWGIARAGRESHPTGKIVLL